MSRTTNERLADILDAIRRARLAMRQLSAAADEGNADAMEIAFDAILQNLLVIGESAKALPQDLLDQEPLIPWREIKGMRDIVGHHYHRVEPATIRRTMDTSIDPLESAVRRLLDADA